MKPALVATALAAAALTATACNGPQASHRVSTADASPSGHSLTHQEVDAVLAAASPSSWKVVTAGPLSVSVPTGWRVTRYLGEPAPVVSPLLHISTSPLKGVCASPQRAVQLAGSCFDHQWPAPPAGVVLTWSAVQIPAVAVST